MKSAHSTVEIDPRSWTATTSSAQNNERLFFILPSDWTWWMWTATAVFLAIGLTGCTGAYVAAMTLTAVQGLIMLRREKRLGAFAVQQRIGYLLFLAVAFIPGLRWLNWLPAIGTFGLVIFGYCLMARTLALLPWNRNEPLALEYFVRVFTSRPRMVVQLDTTNQGCAGGMCTIAAQIRPRVNTRSSDPPSQKID